DGVEYVLRFGQLQVQTDSADGEAPVDPTAVEEAAKDAAARDGKDLRRYLFVMARFNEDAIPKPQLKELPAAADSERTKEEAAPAEEAEPAAESNPEAAGGDQAESLQDNEPTDE